MIDTGVFRSPKENTKQQRYEAVLIAGPSAELVLGQQYTTIFRSLETCFSLSLCPLEACFSLSLCGSEACFPSSVFKSMQFYLRTTGSTFLYPLQSRAAGCSSIQTRKTARHQQGDPQQHFHKPVILVIFPPPSGRRQVSPGLVCDSWLSCIFCVRGVHHSQAETHSHCCKDGIEVWPQCAKKKILFDSVCNEG